MYIFAIMYSKVLYVSTVCPHLSIVTWPNYSSPSKFLRFKSYFFIVLELIASPSQLPQHVPHSAPRNVPIFPHRAAPQDDDGLEESAPAGRPPG